MSGAIRFIYPIENKYVRLRSVTATRRFLKACVKTGIKKWEDGKSINYLHVGWWNKRAKHTCCSFKAVTIPGENKTVVRIAPANRFAMERLRREPYSVNKVERKFSCYRREKGMKI